MVTEISQAEGEQVAEPEHEGSDNGRVVRAARGETFRVPAPARAIAGRCRGYTGGNFRGRTGRAKIYAALRDGADGMALARGAQQGR